MYSLDTQAIRQAIRDSGYRSIGALADAMGVHRNTIHHYLKADSIFPDKLERLLDFLQLDPRQLIIQTHTPPNPALIVAAPIFDALQERFPDTTFVLFGSRARSEAPRYADWDIGVFRAQEVMHDEYRHIVQFAEELFDDTAYFVDVVNLHQADAHFFASISKDWQFICGSWTDWVRLQQFAKDTIHEGR